MRLFLLLVVLALAPPSSAQPARPIPYPVLPPAYYELAVEQGTRTASGAPGPAYWTNYAEYDIEATLRPSENLLVGSATIRYRNNSPDDLDELFLHIRQNLLRPEAQRNWPIGETTSGMEIESVLVEGEPLPMRAPNEGASYFVQGTLMRIGLPTPMLAGEERVLSFTWRFTIPAGAPRMGRDSTAYFLGYWYPQVGVYDDLHGWDVQQYRGAAEFYMEFADYDVTVRAPEGWLVAATGVLQNTDEVLAEPVRRRLRAAANSTDVVAVVTADARGAGTATLDVPGDTLEWHFTAERVRDFAFGASSHYVWDAVMARVGDADGDGSPDSALVNALYRPQQSTWTGVAEFGRFGLEFLSEYIMPYPYPHATAVEGPFPVGGIEYPMITLMGGNPPPRALFEMTVHEFAHNWWPMIVGSNEKRYMWMDEGPTHFSTQRAGEAYYEGWRSFNPDELYLTRAGTESPIMRHGDLYPTIVDLLIAIYPKPSIAFKLLGGLYGPEHVDEALRVYSQRWAFKHPAPWDFFGTIEEELGEDLDWLWTSWFYETWVVDQGVVDAKASERGILVTVDDEGLAPMPVPVRVTYADGRMSEQVLSVSAWLAGNRQATMLFPVGEVERVEVDPAGFMPDIDRSNNVWTP